MKTITKFVNEFTGEEFTNETKCLHAIEKSKGIKELFSFWKKYPKESNCNFENGEYCYQRTKEEFDKLIDTFIIAVKKFEPWIYSQYSGYGGLKPKYVIGSTFLGRYLGDNDSELYEWWCLQSNICPKCYREYGQPYFAINCGCNNKIETKSLSK
jgi:hypothetical protein